MQDDRLIKGVLVVDAISCLAMGAGLLAAGGPLTGLFGLSESLLRGAGAALVPIGLFILATARRQQVPAWALVAIIAGNGLWVAASLVLAAGAREASALGTAFVLAQAGAVGVLTVLEMLGAGRARRAREATA